MVNKYPFHIDWSEDDQEYMATCPAFPGLSAFGQSEVEALEEGKVALAGFIETCEANRMAVPDPPVREVFSGKLQLRLPKTLHRAAVQMANIDDVSLNTYITDAIRAKVTGAQVAKPIIEELRRQAQVTQLTLASVAMSQQPIARYTDINTTKETSTEHTILTVTGTEGRKGN